MLLVYMLCIDICAYWAVRSLQRNELLMKTISKKQTTDEDWFGVVTGGNFVTSCL